jgi:CspA family cold shock protein
MDFEGDLTGIVKFFNKESGYGFILLGEESEVFFHVSNVEPAHRPLYKNEIVRFKIVHGVKGLMAVEVKRSDK